MFVHRHQWTLERRLKISDYFLPITLRSYDLSMIYSRLPFGNFFIKKVAFCSVLGNLGPGKIVFANTNQLVAHVLPILGRKHLF